MKAHEHEYFIVANSFAAPFCSDQSTGFQASATPQGALGAFASRYSHPAGLYAAEVYQSSDAYHKGAKPLARWLSNHAKALEGATSYRSDGPGRLEINGKPRVIENPKAGSVVVA